MKADGPLAPAPLWTSIATGQPPAVHGIEHDTMKAPGRYALRPVTADRRRAPAIWTIAGARGLTVGVAGWAVTFPAEDVNGFLISDALDPETDPSRGEIFPPGALGEAGRDVETFPIPEGAREAAGLDPGLEASFATDLAVLSRGLSLYRVYQPRLALFRVRSLGYASHRFWQYHETSYLQVAAARGERVDPERAADLAGAIPGAYAFLDGYIELLMEQLPEQATLLIVSDHGFRGVTMKDYVHVDLDEVAARLGLLARNGDGAPDWDRTVVFDLLDPEDLPRGYFLNRAGSEAHGIVAEEDATRVGQRAADRLRNLVSDDMEPLFDSVVIDDERASGGPDILLKENPRIDPSGTIAAGDQRIRILSLYRRYSEEFGAHDSTGMLLAAGGGIATGSRGWEAGPYDIVPTLLALLGLPQAEDMPGRPIRAMLSDAAAGAADTVVKTYADLEAAPSPVLRPETLVERDLRHLREARHLRSDGVRVP